MTKLVCRLFDADGRMLGWCAHTAAVRGDGLLRAASHVLMGVAQSGIPHELSIHWADVNAEIRVPMPEGSVREVQSGEIITIFQPDQPMVVAGQPPQRRLPPVSVGSVMVGVPAGALGTVPSGVIEVRGAA